MGYCRRCGKPFEKEQKLCASCGYEQYDGEAYCQNCGHDTRKGQKYCIACGFELYTKEAAETAGMCNYCRNCGKEVKKGQSVCLNCGFKPLDGETFCQNCGATTQIGQKLCTECGFLLEGTKADEAEVHIEDVSEKRLLSRPEVTGYSILGFLLPIIGLIIYLINSEQDPKACKPIVIASAAGVALQFVLGVMLL